MTVAQIKALNLKQKCIVMPNELMELIEVEMTKHNMSRSNDFIIMLLAKSLGYDLSSHFAKIAKSRKKVGRPKVKETV